MATTTPVRRDAHEFDRTPIWDQEFASRWEELHAEAAPQADPPARKPRSKTTSK
jgi:hypothetical protein